MLENLTADEDNLLAQTIAAFHASEKPKCWAFQEAVLGCGWPTGWTKKQWGLRVRDALGLAISDNSVPSILSPNFKQSKKAPRSEVLTREEQEKFDQVAAQIVPGMQLGAFCRVLHSVGCPPTWGINKWAQRIRDHFQFEWGDRSLAGSLTTWKPIEYPALTAEAGGQFDMAMRFLAGVTQQMDFCERVMILGVPAGWTRVLWACYLRDALGYDWPQASLSTQLAPGRREQNKDNCRRWIELPGNREANNKRVLEYMLDRLANDPLFALGNRLRVHFLRLTKADGVSKEDGGLFHFDLPDGRHSFTRRELLGCSVEDFHAHIERQFAEGMTWQNWGEWEYDHRIPIKAFYDNPSIEVLRIVCHWSNWQPLWWPENRTKGGNYCRLELAALLAEEDGQEILEATTGIEPVYEDLQSAA